MANPGNVDDGLLKVTFTDWKNAATTKKLEGFSIDIAEKVDFISNGATDTRWSLVQKFQEIDFYTTEALN